MQLLKRTKQSAARERGVHGQSVLDLHQQLTGVIARRSGQADVAAFLARPSRNKATGEILWYTDLPGPVRPWSDLSAEEQVAAQPQVDAVLAAILGTTPPGATSQAEGADERLAVALGHDPATGSCRYNPTDLYLVGGVPVLAAWGVEAVDGSTEQVPLTNIVAAPAPPPPPPVSPPPATAPVAAAAAAPVAAPASRWPAWLWALLILALLLLLASGLLRACAPPGLPGVAAPPSVEATPPPAAVPPADVAEEEALRREIAELGRTLEERAEACVVEEPAPLSLPPEPAAEPEPEPEPEPPVENPEESERLDREGADIGEVNVSLMWNNHNDLDLAVVDPHGERINFTNRRSQSGGRLDVDMNANSLSRTPIENISWEAGTAPSGTYKVLVALYDVKERGSPPTPFTVTITVMGERSVHQGVIPSNRRRQWIPIAEFTVP